MEMEREKEIKKNVFLLVRDFVYFCLFLFFFLKERKRKWRRRESFLCENKGLECLTHGQCPCNEGVTRASERTNPLQKLLVPLYCCCRTVNEVRVFSLSPRFKTFLLLLSYYYFFLWVACLLVLFFSQPKSLIIWLGRSLKQKEERKFNKTNCSFSFLLVETKTTTTHGCIFIIIFFSSSSRDKYIFILLLFRREPTPWLFRSPFGSFLSSRTMRKIKIRRGKKRTTTTTDHKRPSF